MKLGSNWCRTSKYSPIQTCRAWLSIPACGWHILGRTRLQRLLFKPKMSGEKSNIVALSYCRNVRQK
eukprot:jgi/Botrbrau1/16142/Bobra.0349s0004.1